MAEKGVRVKRADSGRQEYEGAEGHDWERSDRAMSEGEGSIVGKKEDDSSGRG